MVQLTKKTLIELANSLNAVDVTHDNTCRDGYRTWQEIAWSCGTYGVNAKLFKDNQGNFYVIKARSSAIFMY